MGKVIYIDVLVFLNIYVGFFLIKGTARLINTAPSKWRLFWGSMLSGFYSLLILFDLSDGKLVVIKLFMGASITAAVFSNKSIIEFIKNMLWFFAVNFIYGGVMLAVWVFAAPYGMVFKNGVAYFHISALTLVSATVAAYAAISFVCVLLERRNPKSLAARVLIAYKGRETQLNGFIDTGNKLCDVFSGLPVIVCEYSSLAEFFPKKLESYFKNPLGYDYYKLSEAETAAISKLKIIPITVMNGESALPAFKPDKLLINDKSKNAVVAVTSQKLSNGEFDAIIHPALL